MKDYKARSVPSLVSIQATEMEIIFNIISALICTSIISPVASYYVYDDEPNGPASKANRIAFVKYGSLHKKRFTGNKNPRYLKSSVDAVIDSHFSKVMKALPMTFDQVQSWKGKERQVQRITENYNVVQQRNGFIQEESERERSKRKLQTNKQQVKTDKAPREIVKTLMDRKFNPKYNEIPLDSKNNRNLDTKDRKQSGNDKERYEKYQKEHLNKKQLPDKKSPKVSNARPTTMAQAPTHYRKVPLDHNAMRSILEDISTKMTKKYENKKRETRLAGTVTPRPVNRDSMVKYIADVTKEHFERAEAGRIGSPVLQIDTNDAPYAVFYRMNPASVHEQDEIFMNTVEDRYKRLNGADDMMVSNHKTKHTGNLILHKMMKNFSNFKKL